MSGLDRPAGVFIPFALADDLAELTLAEVGRVFRALLRYGETGEEPTDLPNRASRLAWSRLKAAADNTAARYYEKVGKTAYRAYRRGCRKRGEEPEKRENWLKEHGPRSMQDPDQDDQS